MVIATVDVYLGRDSKTPDITITTKGMSIHYAKQESFNELRRYVRTNQLDDIYYFEVILADEKTGKYLDADAGYLEHSVFHAC